MEEASPHVGRQRADHDWCASRCRAMTPVYHRGFPVERDSDFQQLGIELLLGVPWASTSYSTKIVDLARQEPRCGKPKRRALGSCDL